MPISGDGVGGWLLLAGLAAGILLLWRQRLSNCLIVALWLWSLSRCRATLWHRRSLRFLGVIPHFGTAHRTGFRRVVAIEGIPRHRDLGTPRNLLVVFQVGFRVWELRVVRSYRVRTLADAVAAAFGGTGRPPS